MNKTYITHFYFLFYYIFISIIVIGGLKETADIASIVTDRSRVILDYEFDRTSYKIEVGTKTKRNEMRKYKTFQDGVIVVDEHKDVPNDLSHSTIIFKSSGNPILTNEQNMQYIIVFHSINIIFFVFSNDQELLHRKLFRDAA